MKVRDRERALLELIEENRDRECAHLLKRAREEASELLRQTYRRERRNLHRRVVDERARARARIETAAAEMATHRRQRVEKAHFALLTAAWPRLRQRLSARWRQPEMRRCWADRYFAQALRILPHRAWTIRYAPGWGLQERQAFEEALAGVLDDPPGFVEDPAIGAGFVIQTPGASLDASLEGLLADRRVLEAHLLGLLPEDKTP